MNVWGALSKDRNSKGSQKCDTLVLMKQQVGYYISTTRNIATNNYVPRDVILCK